MVKNANKISAVRNPWFVGFSLLTLVSTGALFSLPEGSSSWIAPLNALASIGTSGLVAFIFYLVVNERLETSRHQVLKEANLQAFRNAKRNIAIAILHASQKGGRTDLAADTDTIASCLDIMAFRAMFSKGRHGHEGFYAFQNQMSDETYEFSEIVFNLKIIESAAERLLSAGIDLSEASYKQLIGLSHIVRRIEKKGAGYDESKGLCNFVWQMFAGWDMIDGELDHDPVERIFLEA